MPDNPRDQHIKWNKIKIWKVFAMYSNYDTPNYHKCCSIFTSEQKAHDYAYNLANEYFEEQKENLESDEDLDKIYPNKHPLFERDHLGLYKVWYKHYDDYTKLDSFTRNPKGTYLWLEKLNGGPIIQLSVDVVEDTLDFNNDCICDISLESD
jgi:hypothetical protein